MKQEKNYVTLEFTVKILLTTLLLTIMTAVLYECFRPRPVRKVPPIQFDKFVRAEPNQENSKTMVKDTLNEPLSQTFIIKENLVVDSFIVSKKHHHDYGCTLVLFMGKMKQEIELECGWIDGYKINSAQYGCIAFGQYNYDNYKDFKIHNLSSGNGWVSNHIFLFNPKTWKFELNEILTSKGSLSYDRKNDVYQSHRRSNMFNFYDERFILRNGKTLVLKALDVSTEKVDTTTHIVRKLIVGRDTMVSVFKERIHDQEDLYKLDPVYRGFVDFFQKHSIGW